MNIKIKELSPDPNSWRPLPEVWNEYLAGRRPQNIPVTLFWIKFQNEIHVAIWHPALKSGLGNGRTEVGLLGISAIHPEQSLYGGCYWDISNSYQAQLVRDHMLVLTGPK